MRAAGSTRPRRVLHVLNGAGGGAALSTIGLIGGLAAEGVESSVYCHDAGTREEQDALRDAVEGRAAFGALRIWNRKLRAKAWKRPLLEAYQLGRTGLGGLSLARVAVAALRWRAQMIHTNTILTLEGGRAARLLGLPHIWHVRELVGETFVLPLAGAALGRYLTAHASHVIANSEATARRIVGILPAGLLTVVPNAIDVRSFEPKRHVRGPRVVVGMVASLTSRMKRHELFVRAGAEARRLAPDLGIELVIVGHDPSRGGTVPGDAYTDGLIAQIARAGMTPHVTLAGYQPDPARVMAGLDLLVHPAEGESFGRIVVEAMAAGLPVVGVDGGGVGELVVDGVTGVLAPVGDAARLGAAIARLAADVELRGRLGAAGRARVEQRHAMEAHVRAVLAVYEAAARRPLRALAGPVAA